MYQVIMLMVVPIQFGTGIILWDLTRFATWVEALGGVRVVSTIHVLCFIFFVFFILVHAYLGALGRTPGQHYKAMFTGYEEEPEEGEA
jgi:thiosulfate reductase cytochrome b subunit